MRIGETPVPIPNTMVKTYTADGTALETVWESRWPPVSEKSLVSDLIIKTILLSNGLLKAKGYRVKYNIHCTLKISHGEKCLYKRLNLKYNIEDIEIYLMYVLMRTKKRLYLG